MKTWIKPFVFAWAMWVACAAVHAQDTGATTSGNWNNASIWTAGTVPGSSNNVYIGSTYPSGAASTATVALTANESAANVYLGNGSGTSGTLNLGGNTLTIGNDLVIGQSGGTGVLNEGGGSFTATNAYVQNGNSLSFGASDAVSFLSLTGGSSATTAATGNVTGNVQVYSGSTLNLGASMSLTGSFDARDTGTIINLNGNALAANSIYLGYYDGEPVTLNRGGAGGTLTATNLLVGNTTFNLLSTDSVTNYYLNNATSTLNSSVSSLQLVSGSNATTTAAGNVTGGVQVFSGSTLNLGANLNLSGSLDIRDLGTTVNAHGFGITANSLLVGFYDTQPVSLINNGTVNVANLYVGNGSALTLHGGDVVSSLLSLTGGSTLTVQQVNGIGLTLNGTSPSSLTIDPSSMDLIFNLNTSPNWDFRWQDPSGGNWISTLDSMIASGQIVVDAPQGYNVVDMGGYTYIDGNYSQSVVPEPSSLLLACLASLGVAAGITWRRRHRGA